MKLRVCLILNTHFVHHPDVVSSLLQDTEAALLVRRQSRTWCWCMCLGLALMLSGVVVAGAYLYRYYVLEVSGCPVSSEDVPFVQNKLSSANEAAYVGKFGRIGSGTATEEKQTFLNHLFIYLYVQLKKLQ